MQPAELPPELIRRLLANEPLARGARSPWSRAMAGFREAWRRPWPLAYAGLLAVWALILALRVLTPTVPESAAAPAYAAQAGPIPADTPVFAGTFLFARNNSDQF